MAFDGQTDGGTNRRKDGWMINRQMDGRTEVTYGGGCPPKNSFSAQCVFNKLGPT